jgi:cysteine desulfurase
LHKKLREKYIYADNAATTRLDIKVFEAMKPYLLNEYGNAASLYSFSRSTKKALKESRETIANCIGSIPTEIYFTSGGTESDNWAIKGTAFKLKGKGRHIITSKIEHHAVLNSCNFLEKQGFEVTYLDVDTDGNMSSVSLFNAIRKDTILISVMLANNEIGTIQNISELVLIAHEKGILFHCDAVQAVGHIPIYVDKLGVDLLSASAHKFNGPKGIGFLYKRSNVEIDSYMSGGGQEYGSRAGTENIASIVAMATALKINCDDVEKNIQYLNYLTNIFDKELLEKQIDYILNGSENRLPGNRNISIKGYDGEMLLHRLDLKGIVISTGSACNSKDTQISHVIKAIAVPEEYAQGTIRITLGKENTKDDVVKIVEAIKDICSYGKQ